MNRSLVEAEEKVWGGEILIRGLNEEQVRSLLSYSARLV